MSRFIEQLSQSAQDAQSRDAAKNLARVLGNETYKIVLNGGISPELQERARVASNLLSGIWAEIEAEDSSDNTTEELISSGCFTTEWRDQLGGLTVRGGEE